MPPQLPPVGGTLDVGPTNNIGISNMPPPTGRPPVFLPPVGGSLSPQGQPKVNGMLTQPTLDFFAQPRVKNQDGSTSTVRSISIEQDGKEILIPTVSDGSDGTPPHILSDGDAILQFYRTKKHMGIFDSAQSATAFAQQVHTDYEQGRYDAPQQGQPQEPTRGGFTAAQLEMMGVRPGSMGMAGDTMTDLVKGGAKALIEHATNVGDLARRYVPGLNRVEQAVGLPVAVNTQATNPTQTVGKGLESVAEVIAPTGAISGGAELAATQLAPRLAPMVGRTLAEALPRAAVQGTAAGAQAYAQGGSPTWGAAIGAGVPFIGSLGAAKAPQLYAGALKQVEKALGGTKEYYKAIGSKIAPEVLRRGLSGSREALLEQASQMADDFGEQIEAVWQQFGDRPIATQPILDALEAAKGQFFRMRQMTPQQALQEGYLELTAAGQPILKEGAKLVGNMVELPVVFEDAAIKHLTALQRIIKRFGPEAPAEHLRAARQEWGKVVAEAGGFAHRAAGGIGKPLSDISKISAKREAYGAIRQVLLKDFPETAALNREYTFWADLQDLVRKTLQRTAPQKQSLGGQVAEAAGAAMGSHHGLGLAFFGAKMNKMLHQVLSSPRWLLMSGRMRNALAEALTDSSKWRLTNVLTRMLAILGSGTDEKAETQALRQATSEQLAKAGAATLGQILSAPSGIPFDHGRAQMAAWSALSPDARHYMYGNKEAGIASYFRAYSRRALGPSERSYTVAWVGPDKSVHLRYPLEDQAVALTPEVMTRLLMTEGTAKLLAEALDRPYAETAISAGLAAELINAARSAGATIKEKSPPVAQGGPKRNDTVGPYTIQEGQQEAPAPMTNTPTAPPPAPTQPLTPQLR